MKYDHIPENEKAPVQGAVFHDLLCCLDLRRFRLPYRSACAAVADGLKPPREVTFPIRPLIIQRGTVRRCHPLQLCAGLDRTTRIYRGWLLDAKTAVLSGLSACGMLCYIMVEF